MNGALPPSSIDVRLTVSAHRRWSDLPTSVEPVKLSLRTASLDANAPPTVSASPVTTFSTPGGETCALGERDESQGAERRLFGGFKDHHASGGERRRRFTGHHRRRKVPRVTAATTPTGWRSTKRRSHRRAMG